MNKILKWAGRGLIAVGALAVVGVIAIYAVSSAKLSSTFEVSAGSLALTVDHDDPALIAEGQRLATLTGCNGCHGTSMAGRVFIDIPNVVRLVAPNITAFTAEADDEALVRLIRFGVKPDGTSVLGMPSTSFHHISDNDLAAIIAFLRSQPVLPDGTDQTTTFRALARLGLALGEFELPAAEFADGKQRRPAPDRSDPKQLGAYLARLACAECHGQDLNGQPDRATPSLAIVRGYGRDTFDTLMDTGIALGGREVGLMTRVARGRFSEFTETEIDALYAYLRDLGEGVSNSP